MKTARGSSRGGGLACSVSFGLTPGARCALRARLARLETGASRTLRPVRVGVEIDVDFPGPGTGRYGRPLAR